MKTLHLLLIITLVPLYISSGSSTKMGKGNDPILIEESADLKENVGKRVTIRGEVSNTKIPQILGVDITRTFPDLRGKVAKATGILESWVVHEKELDKYSANRGAGTFYRLKDAVTGETVQVMEIQL